MAGRGGRIVVAVVRQTSSKPAGLFCFLLLMSLLGCGSTNLHVYPQWQISSESKAAASTFRNYRSGHLVVHGGGLVLEVESDYDPNIFITDDEICWTTWVEI